MFETLTRKVEALAARRAAARRLEVAEQLRAALPRSVSADVETNGISLAGRGLKRRFVLDPALRWIAAGLR